MDDTIQLDDDELITNAYLLLMAVRKHPLRQRDDGHYEISGHEYEISFHGDEVNAAKNAGMLEMMGDEIVLGLSDLGKRTIENLESYIGLHYEFVPPPPQPMTIH